jgi:O-antigen/teichoic acid export membrane protein
VPVTIFVVVLVFVLPQPSLNRAGMAYVAGSAVPTAIWLWLTIRSHTPRVDASRFKNILRGSYLYGVTALLSYSSFKSGILLLLVLSSAREVAFFAAAFKLVELGYKIPILANRLIAPHLFADSVHRPREFLALCDALLHATGALSALTAVVLFVLGAGFIQLIFGSEFAPAAPLLQILGVSLALKTLALVAQSIVTSADQLGFRTRALGWATAFGTVISVPLIVEWGAKGAATGVLIADVALLAALFWRLRILLPATRLTSLVAVPFAAATMAIGFAGWMELPGAFELAAAVMLVIAVLFLSGYLQPVLRLARSGDLQR